MDIVVENNGENCQEGSKNKRNMKCFNDIKNFSLGAIFNPVNFQENQNTSKVE